MVLYYAAALCYTLITDIYLWAYNEVIHFIACFIAE